MDSVFVNKSVLEHTTYGSAEDLRQVLGAHLDLVDFAREPAARALPVAVALKSARLVGVLLEHGASPHVADPASGRTALEICDCDRIRAMLENSRNALGLRAMARRLRCAVMGNDVDELDALYATDAGKQQTQRLMNGCGSSTLMNDAVMSRSLDAFRWLMRRGAKWYERDGLGQTALDLAHKLGAREFERDILGSVCRDDGSRASDDSLATFVDVMAGGEGSMGPAYLVPGRVAREDLKKAWRGMTLLHWAVFYGRVEDVAALASMGADASDKGGIGLTPVELALACGREDLAAVLLSVALDLREREREDLARNSAPPPGEAEGTAAAVEAQ